MSYYREAIRRLEVEREKKRKQAENQLLAAYKKFPQIQEIDAEIKILGLRMSKEALNLSQNLPKLTDDLKKLKEEKHKLIEANNCQKFFRPQYFCGVCKDFGFNKNCRCFKKILINIFYANSNLQHVPKEDSFDNFNFDYYSSQKNNEINMSPRENMELIYKEIQKFVNNFNNPHTNLLFYGRSGLGKSFLCHCIAKEILKKGYSVVYTDVNSFFKKVEQKRFSDEQVDTDIYYWCDLLIMDDLGTEFSTKLTKTELFNIINIRLLKRKSTVISTNLDFDDLQEEYTDRITGRIGGEYKNFKFYGEDIRILKNKGGF